MTHIFISYSHSDTEYAHRLAEALEQYGILVWIDDRINYGTKWPKEIEENLKICCAFVVIMTPRSFASDWVQKELNRAERIKKPIFPLLLEGNDPWFAVETTQYADVRDGKLPPQRFFDQLAVLQETSPKNPAIGSTSAITSPNGTKSQRQVLLRLLILVCIGIVLAFVVLYSVRAIVEAPQQYSFSPQVDVYNWCSTVKGWAGNISYEAGVWWCHNADDKAFSADLNAACAWKYPGTHAVVAQGDGSIVNCAK